MSRIKGSDGKVAAMREALECAVAGMVRIEYVLQHITRLRMEQVRARVGLSELVDPALVELDETVRAARAAKVQVASVLASLAGGD